MTIEMILPDFLEELKDAWETNSEAVPQLIQSQALFGGPFLSHQALQGWDCSFSLGPEPHPITSSDCSSLVVQQEGHRPFFVSKASSIGVLLMSASQHLLAPGLLMTSKQPCLNSIFGCWFVPHCSYDGTERRGALVIPLRMWCFLKESSVYQIVSW